jgi:hypothetical protein
LSDNPQNFPEDLFLYLLILVIYLVNYLYLVYLVLYLVLFTVVPYLVLVII